MEIWLYRVFSRILRPDCSFIHGNYGTFTLTELKVNPPHLNVDIAPCDDSKFLKYCFGYLKNMLRYIFYLAVLSSY